MEAKYVFPVPARAAICGFEMIAEDGTVITALVKEKEEAYIDFKEALHQGYMAGLVEHVTDDSELLRFSHFFLFIYEYMFFLFSFLCLAGGSTWTTNHNHSDHRTYYPIHNMQCSTQICCR